MANVFAECSYCGQEVLLPDAKPPTTLDAHEVRLLISEMGDVVSNKDYPALYMECCQKMLSTLEKMNSEFNDELRSNVAADEGARDEEIFNAERTDDGTV